MKRNLGWMAVILGLTWTMNIQAEEGGSGHYMPGSAASFIDAFPGKPGGLAVLNYTTFYEADASANRQFSLGGILTLGLDAKVLSETVALFYQTEWEVMGGGIAFGVAIPYVWVDVAIQGSLSGGVLPPLPPGRADDAVGGLGDITLVPLMVGWTNIAPDLTLDARLNVFAPTGKYDAGKLANTGLNYWTFEPAIMASWLSSKFGTEATLYTGIDFNTRNEDTDYQSGTSLHFDGTLAQHLPLLGGLAGIGVTGFYYEQIEGDSGAGAVLGSFKAKTTGIGPVISYVREIRSTQLLAELKWMREGNVENRLEGDYVWLKLGVLF